MKNILFFLSFFLFCTISDGVQATYPNSIWSSKRFSESLIGVKFSSLTPDHQHLLTLSQQKISIFIKNQDKLELITEKKASFREKWVKLNLFDINQDGYPEILISGLRFNRPQTQIYVLNQNKLQFIESLPYFTSVIEWGGGLKLAAQKSFGEDLLSGPIYELKFEKNKLQLGNILFNPKTLSVKDFSLYQILGISTDDKPGSFLYLNSNHRFQLYYPESNSKYRSTWMSGVSYGGGASYINRKIKTPLHQEVQDRWFIPVNYHSNQSFLNQKNIKVKNKENIDKYLKNKIIYSIKNEGYLKQLSGKVPSIKYSQMTALTWTGYGFQEVWNSPRLDGAITDFVLVDWDDDGREELLISFLLRDKGFLDTLKNQDSILMVMKPPYDQIYRD